MELLESMVGIPLCTINFHKSVKSYVSIFHTNSGDYLLTLSSGHGAVCRETFNPKYSNLNIHADMDVYKEFEDDVA